MFIHNTISASPHSLSALLILLFLVAGCGGSSGDLTTIEERDGVTYVTNNGSTVWANLDEAPIQFTLEQTFGTDGDPEEAMLANARTFAVDDAGVVYVLDQGNHRIVAFNPDGSVRWSAGREGEGPGEFSYPHSMVSNNANTLYITNQRGTRIDLWSHDGTFIESVGMDAIDARGGIVGFVDGSLALSRAAFGDEPQRIHLIDPSTWTHKQTFDVDFDLDLPDRMGISGSITVQDTDLWVSHVQAYQFRKYTLEGTQIQQIDRPNIDTIIGPGISDDGRLMRTYGALHAPVVLPDGHLLAASSWPTNVKDPNRHAQQSVDGNAEDPIMASALDLFAPDGSFRGRLQWDETRIPGIGRPESVGPDGRLYTTTNDPFPQVRRYTVTVD